MDIVDIVPYDPSWPGRFEEERRRIVAGLGDLAVRVDHHGSTSVPGLAAKPVIDVQVSVARLHPIASYAPGLEALGYVHVPHPDDAFCPFFHRPAGWPHSHHVHVVQAGGEEERRTLAFRDLLRQDSSCRAQYEALKHRLAPLLRAPDEATRQAYTESKGELVVRLTELALARGLPADL